jgi:hypothetical protein
MKGKKTKIITASLLVVAMLVTLPTIAAIQNNNSIQKPETQKLPPHFPLLYLFYIIVLKIQISRDNFWFLLSGTSGHWGDSPRFPFAYERMLYFDRLIEIWEWNWHDFGVRAGWW